MIILGHLWDNWVSKESLRGAAKRVGISAEGLSIHYMQKEKFEQAETIMEVDEEPQSSSRCDVVASPKDIRKGSAQYWQRKYEMAQAIILVEASEKSLKLEEIPGFLPIAKVKPKKNVENTRVTQICGSMEGKDVLQVVEDLKKKKEEKAQAKEAKNERKREQKELFYRCKEKCVCRKSKCEAAGLKECPICHDILRSVCSKAACKVDGKCPQMIIPANHSAKKSVKRKLLHDDNDNLESSESDYTEEESEDDDFATEDEANEVESEVDTLNRVWSSINWPVEEDEIVGRWFAVIYNGKRTKTLYIAKANRRFLEDENGSIDKLLMTCLKPKVGLETLLEDTPKHLPPDQDMFDPWDIIYGPMMAVNHGTDKFEVPKYEEAKKFFHSVKNIDRKKLFFQK